MKETHKIGQIGVLIHVHYFHNQRWRDAVSIGQTIRLLFGAVYHCRRRTGKMVTYIEGNLNLCPCSVLQPSEIPWIKSAVLGCTVPFHEACNQLSNEKTMAHNRHCHWTTTLFRHPIY